MDQLDQLAKKTHWREKLAFAEIYSIFLPESQLFSLTLFCHFNIVRSNEMGYARQEII
jgi:hypothetical protein